MIPGPRPCDSSWKSVWLKYASKEMFGTSAGTRVLSAIGRPLCRNLASITFFRRTFFEPFASRTLSSLGRLNAEVWTPRRASPAV